MELPLKGIIPPVVTPMTSNNSLDQAGLERLIRHMIGGGVHGLFMLGTTGEAPSLTYGFRKELISKTCELVGHKVPVLVGITDTSIEGSVEIANHAADAGADAVVFSSPYYLPLSQEEMREYLESLVPRLPLPFLLYNMPSCTKLHMSVETVRRARDLGAIGIKDSSGDMFYLYSLIGEFKNTPEFSIITGTELFLPDTILHGGHGAVAGGANMFPRLYVDLYNASVARDLEKIDSLRSDVMKIYNTIYNVGRHSSKYLKGTKCALSVMGICDDHMAQPMRKHGMAERNLIEQYLKELEYLIV
jgi:2-dehydro-3-deoxy-D-pentonate aldolase